MSIIRRHETLVATAAECERHGLHEKARTLRAEAATIAPEVEAERARVRVAVGGPLAALAEQARAAAAVPPVPPFVGTLTAEDQRQKMAAALAGVRCTADDVRRAREDEDRETERLRRGGR